MSLLLTAETDGLGAYAELPLIPEWFACYTRARHEKQVVRILGERGVEWFLPLIPREKRWKDRSKTVYWPLFPSYVFARCPARQLSEVLAVPGIATIVRHGGSPAAIPEFEIENVRVFAAALAATRDRPRWVCRVVLGQRVRVIAGPFNGIEGIVREIRGRHCLTVSISVIKLGWRVQLEPELLEPVE